MRFRDIFSILGLFMMGAFAGSLEAGSVRLVNDSPYKLRVVIRANDGTFLGEMVIAPQSTSGWTDGYAGLPGGADATRSQTPYTVLWYCLEGDPFSMCNPVPTASTVTAMTCDGARQCRPQKQKQPEGEPVQPAPPVLVPQQPPPYGQQPPAQQQPYNQQPYGQ
jgi:hypothetical protein